MADVGAIHILEDAQIKATFTEDAVFGLVLTSIEDLVKKTTLSPVAAPLFRVILRDFSEAGVFTTLTPTVSGFVQSASISREDDVTIPTFGPADGLGSRSVITWEGKFSSVGGSTDDIKVAWTVSLLASQPGILLFDAAYGWDTVAGTNLCVFWVGPALLSLPVFTTDQYLVALRSGVVSRKPQTDLAVTTDLFKADSGFEPEVTKFADTNRFEAFYPGSLSTPLSAYGGMKRGEIVMVHGNLDFQGARIRDFYDGADFQLKNDGLQIGAGEPFNAQLGTETDAQFVRTRRYVHYWLDDGEYLGEACGERFHSWFKSSVEGAAIIAGKPGDTTDRARAVVSPVVLSIGPGDLLGTGTNDAKIVTEILEALPGLSEVPTFIHSMFHWTRNFDKTTADGPGDTLQTHYHLPDLFSLNHDPQTATRATAVQAAGAFVFGEIEPRRPQEWDQRLIFGAGEEWGGDLGDDAGGRFIRSGARVTNSVDLFRQLANTYRQTTHQYNTCHTKIITGTISYDAPSDTTSFEIGLGASPALDKFIHAIYSESILDESAGEQFIGICVNEGSGGILTGNAIIRRPNPTSDWEVSPHTVEVKGDHTIATGTGVFGDVSDVLLLYGLGQRVEEETNFFEHYTWLIGHDPNKQGTVENGEIFETAMCPLADTLGDPAHDYATLKKGPNPQLIIDLLAFIQFSGTPFEGLALRRSAEFPLVCFETTHIHSTDGVGPGVGTKLTFTHRPADPAIVTAHRTLLNLLRTQGAASQASEKRYPIIESSGPHDWQVGVTDGHLTANFKNDFSTARGNWGGSSFFDFAFGAYHVGGLYRNRAAFGHIQSGVFLTFWEDNVTIAGARDNRVSAMVADYLFSRKPITIYTLPTAVGENPNSNRSGGETSRTPFFDLDNGMHVAASGASLIARMYQLFQAFDGLPMKAPRARSWIRGSGAATVPHVDPTAPSEGHTMSPFEEGDSRPPLIHACYRHPTKDGVFIAVFVNEAKTARRGGAFTFRASQYRGNAPWGGYTVTRYEFTSTGFTSKALETRGEEELTVTLSLAAGTVEAYEMAFDKSVKFVYAYDEEDETKVPLHVDSARASLEDIHGSGERFTFGVDADLPDSNVRISEGALRVEDLGRSGTK